MGAFDLETGPFAGDRLGDPSPPPDRPSFTGIVADGLADVPALSAYATASAAAVPSDGGAHLDDAYHAVLDGTGDTVNTETAAVGSSPAGQLTDAGQVVPGRAAEVARFLPDPSTTPSVDLTAPPQTPGPPDSTGVGRTIPFPRGGAV